MVAVDVDAVWMKVREYITDEKALVDIGRILIRDTDRFDLYMTDYKIMHDLMDMDDEEYVFGHGFQNMPDEEIDEELQFQIDNNGLKKKRAKKIKKLAQFWRG